MASNKLIVFSVDLDTLKKRKLAEFSLSGGKVASKFEDKLFEKSLKDGVYTTKGMLKPEDGRKFMDALEAAYARSSTISVEPA